MPDHESVSPVEWPKERILSFLRACGPASDPVEWHKIMEQIDPDYETSGPGASRRWLERERDRNA
jgi:hypothetical protein